MAALSINGEKVSPNSTTLKRNVTNGLFGSTGLESQRKRVKSLSVSSMCTCKNAFSISEEKAMLCWRKRMRMAQRSLRNGGPRLRQSFKLDKSGDCLQLQS